jgi:hypothetical protein
MTGVTGPWLTQVCKTAINKLELMGVVFKIAKTTLTKQWGMRPLLTQVYIVESITNLG